MILCSRPSCQTSAGCRCSTFSIENPAPHAAAPQHPTPSRNYTITTGAAQMVTDEMIKRFVLAADGMGVEPGSFLWEQTRRGLQAALTALPR